MKERMNDRSSNPAAFKAMLALERFVGAGGIDKELLELIKLRASLINGCAFCADMHSKDMPVASIGRAAAEKPKRLRA